ncbi:hypothetical protein VKT23_009809 [Stygiomarasmius scandens]|uniref:O-methyltransferase n=1 Tax=Marasmiellus scandens TaxID=2682957 RepID=A0ABR1JJA8_9AGAR
MSTAPTNPLSHHPKALAVLSRLHALSIEQEKARGARGKHFPKLSNFGPFSDDADLANPSDFVEELVALDEDKAQAMYMILRAMGAMRVVEAGTSYGVSLIYLLCAVIDNAKNAKVDRLPPLVIGTELEPAKVSKALSHVQEAFDGRTPEILNLLQGDLLETIPALALPDSSVDALLLDIWAPLALPVLKMMLPKLRKGAVVFLDNSISSVERYKDVLEFLRSGDDETRMFKSISLPFDGGFEMCVYEGN